MPDSVVQKSGKIGQWADGGLAVTFAWRGFSGQSLNLADPVVCPIHAIRESEPTADCHGPHREPMQDFGFFGIQLAFELISKPGPGLTRDVSHI